MKKKSALILCHDFIDKLYNKEFPKFPRERELAGKYFSMKNLNRLSQTLEIWHVGTLVNLLSYNKEFPKFLRELELAGKNICMKKSKPRKIDKGGKTGSTRTKSRAAASA